jgi:hypothetical protein
MIMPLIIDTINPGNHLKESFNTITGKADYRVYGYAFRIPGKPSLRSRIWMDNVYFLLHRFVWDLE